MNKVTRKKTSKYTTISNGFLRDNNLSLKAKGFLTVVMALPDNWDFSIKGICSVLKEGKTSVYSAVQELKENRYCKTTPSRDEKGLIIGLDYVFYEEPYKEEPNKEEPQQDNPHPENRDMDNMPQINTKDDKESNRTKDLPNKEEKDKSFSKKERIDYDAIIKCWNETNPTLSNVRMLNDDRKKQIRNLLASNNATVDDLMKAIKIISMSSAKIMSKSSKESGMLRLVFRLSLMRANLELFTTIWQTNLGIIKMRNTRNIFGSTPRRQRSMMRW